MSAEAIRNSRRKPLASEYLRVPKTLDVNIFEDAEPANTSASNTPVRSPAKPKPIAVEDDVKEEEHEEVVSDSGAKQEDEEVDDTDQLVNEVDNDNDNDNDNENDNNVGGDEDLSAVPDDNIPDLDEDDSDLHND